MGLDEIDFACQAGRPDRPGAAPTAKGRAEAASRAKSSFIANMSHEPAHAHTAIIGMNSLACTGPTDS